MRDYIAEIPEEYREAVKRSLTGNQPREPRPQKAAPRSSVMPSLGNALAVMECFEPTEEYVEPEPPNCSRCDDTGWLRRDAWEGNMPPNPPYRECPDCDLTASRRRSRFEKLAPVQPPYDTYTFAGFPAKTPAMKSVRAGIQKLARSEPCSVFISGPIGCGKTSLATCLYREWERTTPGMWFLTPKLFEHIRKGFDKETREYTADQLVEAVYSVPLLFLDDLGAEYLTRWVAEVLFKIIYSRDGPGKHTIITSNFRLSELVDHLAASQHDKIAAERIASRIKGLCGARVYWVDGPDLR